jgi:hypothetical protein
MSKIDYVGNVINDATASYDTLDRARKVVSKTG